MIYNYKNLQPRIHESVFIAPSADIIGDVHIGRDSGVWFNVTVRGDVHHIRIGEETNIQDNCVLHVTNGKYALTLGDRITVGHGAVLHGCTIENDTLIGMQALILDDATIGSGSIIAAGSLVREGQRFPSGVLIAGSPARVKRELRPAEFKKNLLYAKNYVNYKNTYLRENQFSRLFEEI